MSVETPAPAQDPTPEVDFAAVQPGEYLPALADEYAPDKGLHGNADY